MRESRVRRAMSMNGGTRIVGGSRAGCERFEALANAADRIEAAGAPVDACAGERAVEHEHEAVGGRVDGDRLRRGFGERAVTRERRRTP